MAKTLIDELLTHEIEWGWDYSPYRTLDGKETEIPAYEIFGDAGEKIADTNENLLADNQLDVAMLMAASPRLFVALHRALTALNTVPRFDVPGLDCDSYDVALLCEEAIALAKGKSG
jgi:hypothetical protein